VLSENVINEHDGQVGVFGTHGVAIDSTYFFVGSLLFMYFYFKKEKEGLEGKE
jgi:hypothetical protein